MKTSAMFRSILVSLFLASTAHPAEATKPLNVVFILSDDQGAWALHANGASEFQTPNLDGMAKEGCKFTNFHVAQPVCSASRANCRR